jgi:outer membrane protein assembly factor BamA
VSKEISSRLAASLFYNYQFHRPETKLDAYDRQGATLSLNYGLTEKLFFEGSVGWTSFDYTKQKRDFSDIPWSANARYILSPSLRLRAGYSKSYNDTSSQTPATAGSFMPASEGIIYPGESYIIIDGKAIPASSVLLDSIDGGLYRSESFTVGVSYSAKMTVIISGFLNKNKYMDIDRDDRSTGGNLTVTMPLTSLLTANASGLYSYNKYRPENEKVNRYGARLALDYALKITTLTLGYAFSCDDSNFDGNDYTTNVVWIGARFVF